MAASPLDSLDEIDKNLIQILAQNPRAPYVAISEELADRGYDLTGEAIRNRVSKILEAVSVFFLFAPEEHGWEIVRIAIEVENEPNAVETVYEELKRTSAWLVCKGMGSFDLWAVGTLTTNQDVQALLEEIRGIEYVADVRFFLETERATTIEKYLNV